MATSVPKTHKSGKRLEVVLREMCDGGVDVLCGVDTKRCIIIQHVPKSTGTYTKH